MTVQSSQPGIVRGAERVVDDLLASVGWDDAPRDRLRLSEAGSPLATPWPVAAMATAALAAVGLAASRLAELRTGERPAIALDTRAAGLAMTSSSYLQIDGRNAKFRDPFTGFYRAREGRHVFLHGNFPHLRDGLIDMLGGANDPNAVAEAVGRRSAPEIEAEAIERGLCAAFVRSPEEWRREAQAGAIAELGVVELSRLADAAPRRWEDTDADGPLAGLRALDLSRVIAGPMAGRTLAEHGATVMLVSSPNLPSIESLVVDTGFGKLSASIDLDAPEGPDALRVLAAEADIFLDAYRPGALAGRGFSAEALAALRPGLVHVSLCAFSVHGPWRGRRGYDSLVQSTMGMAWRGPGETPRLLPCQPLDYLTGYLAAFGAMLALIRQAGEGGTWRAELSLAATAQWMWRQREALGDAAVWPERNPSAEEIPEMIAHHASPFGTLSVLAPPLRVGGRPGGWGRGPVPLGSDPAAWPARP